MTRRSRRRVTPGRRRQRTDRSGSAPPRRCAGARDGPPGAAPRTPRFAPELAGWRTPPGPPPQSGRGRGSVAMTSILPPRLDPGVSPRASSYKHVPPWAATNRSCPQRRGGAPRQLSGATALRRARHPPCRGRQAAPPLPVRGATRPHPLAAAHRRTLDACIEANLARARILIPRARALGNRWWLD
jgi:hypothetical protein